MFAHLYWDDNKTALWELNEKLMNGDLFSKVVTFEQEKLVLSVLIIKLETLSKCKYCDVQLF